MLAIQPIVIVLVGVFIFNNKYAQAIIIEVETKYGKILGETLFDWDGGLYYSFQSIPYAEPPINNLRFKAPVPPKPWNVAINGTKPAPTCPQYVMNNIVGQEDCLYLNVYTKSLNKFSKLPVLVFIHGGGYYIGSGNSIDYGPDFLMTKNIVLVTFNYRLGYLGALSFKDQTKGVPGNAHMKDQVMVLKWVRDNIHIFGGDKNLVTAVGQSVGGASAHMHLLSPLSKGLVHRIIAQSGCALSAWNYGNLGTGERIAAKLGITCKNTGEIIKKLQAIPMEEFVRKTQEPGELSVPVNILNDVAPVIEQQQNEPAFLPTTFSNLILNAPSNIPILFGYNNNESLIFQVEREIYAGQSFAFDDLDSTIPHDIKLPNKQERLKLINSIKNVFFKGGMENIEETSLYGLGPWVVAGLLQSIRQHLEVNHNVYLYVFSSDTNLNWFKHLHPITSTYKGASHNDELGYLFKMQNTPSFSKNSVEDLSWRKTVQVWTNFAQYGKPTLHLGLSLKKVTDWMCISYVNIDRFNLIANFEPDEVVWKFWRNVYEKYNF